MLITSLLDSNIRGSCDCCNQGAVTTWYHFVSATLCLKFPIGNAVGLNRAVLERERKKRILTVLSIFYSLYCSVPFPSHFHLFLAVWGDLYINCFSMILVKRTTIFPFCVRDKTPQFITKSLALRAFVLTARLSTLSVIITKQIFGSAIVPSRVQLSVYGKK